MGAKINRISLRKIASHRKLRKLPRLHKQNIYLFLLGLSLTVGDSKLILATSIFIASIFVSYKIDRRSIQNYYRYFFSLFTSPLLANQKLVRTITIAGILGIFVYFTGAIYQDLEHKSLATFFILQTLFTTLGIGFFCKKLWSSSSKQKKGKISPVTFEQLISQFDDKSPVIRLQAINTVMNLWQKQQLNHDQVQQLQEYFKLLQNIELEPVILAKIDRSLGEISPQNSQQSHISRRHSPPKQKHPVSVRSNVKVRGLN